MKLLNKEVTFDFQPLGSLYYGKTRKTGHSYKVTINTDVPELRQKLALVHEGLHVIGPWEAGYNPSRHRGCHYLACAILSGWKAKDLKLTITQAELDEFVATLASVWNNRSSGTTIPAQTSPQAAASPSDTAPITPAPVAAPVPEATTTGSTFFKPGQVITFPYGGSITLQTDGILADLRNLTSSNILDNMMWVKKNASMIAEPYNTLIIKYLNNAYSSSLKDEFFDQVVSNVLADEDFNS